MDTKQKIEVMQGYVNGEQIQVFNHLSQEWNDITNPEWQWDLYKYRIKPEPKYRPLKPEELIELKGKWLKQKVLSGICMVISISAHGAGLNNGVYNAKELLDLFTYEDGSPVGVLEDK